MRILRFLEKLMKDRDDLAGLLIFLAAFLFAAQVCAIEIPLEKQGGVYTLPVRINGVITLNFILDSGASEVSIPADVASTLVRTGTIKESDFLPGKLYSLADGSTLKSPRFLIRELEFGGIKIYNVPGSVSPPAGDLLLGQSLLERLDSWALDNRRHVLVLGERVQSQARKTPSSESDKTWLVICGTFSREDRTEAVERLSILRNLGFEARIESTDKFPNLKSDLIIVVSGPFSKDSALNIADKMKKQIPGGVYVKEGW